MIHDIKNYIFKNKNIILKNIISIVYSVMGEVGYWELWIIKRIYWSELYFLKWL